MVGRQVLKRLKELHPLEEAVEKLQHQKPDVEKSRQFSKSNRFGALQQQESESSFANDGEISGDDSSEMTSTYKRKHRRSKQKRQKDIEESITGVSEAVDEISNDKNSILDEQIYNSVAYTPYIAISLRHLNYQNEFLRKYGGRSNTGESNVNNVRGHAKSNIHKRYEIFVSSAAQGIYIDHAVESGLIMECVQGSTFKYCHSKAYQSTEQEFINIFIENKDMLSFVGTKSENLNSLIYVSELYCIQEDNTALAKISDYCILLLQNSLNPRFQFSFEKQQSKILANNKSKQHKSISQLPYNDYYENRAFHIVLFRHALLLSNRGLPRTALEICKVLLNLDSEDPLAINLIIDVFAIRSGEYQFLTNYFEEHADRYHLYNIPGMCFHYALALFMLKQEDKAKLAMIKAAKMFPGTLYMLLDRLSIQTDSRTESLLLSLIDDPNVLRLLSFLFVERLHYSTWSSTTVLRFLEQSVMTIEEFYDRSANCDIFKGLIPIQVRRHIALSDKPGNETSYMKEMLMAEKLQWESAYGKYNPLNVFNPFPPISNIFGPYTIQNDPSSTQSLLGSFIGSIFPNQEAANLLGQITQRLFGHNTESTSENAGNNPE
ncbi:hypothetical protein GJ496_001648 [Pomphorhynchus laevis]|nr:hypothetical protein GJ496_001648 [Pomphorhynchus laevis]